jgi:hypothetical protein
MDTYKFKKISDENVFYIVNPLDSENGYVIFDSSKFYVGEGTKINIWDELNANSETNDTAETNETAETNIDNDTPIEFNEITMNVDLKKIIYQPITIINSSIFAKVINHYKKVDYTRLYEKYGNVIDDLIPFIENKELDEKNRFNRMKILQNVLSKDVCYWIMHESDKQQWTDCVYTNYDISIPIEKMPGVLNFILFSCHFWLAEVMKIYDIQLGLNIVDIFIAKKTNRTRETQISDDKFITLNIQLNETEEPITYNKDKILLKQGDMLVYNKKIMRERSNNYVLVIMLDFN